MKITNCERGDEKSFRSSSHHRRVVNTWFTSQVMTYNLRWTHTHTHTHTRVSTTPPRRSFRPSVSWSCKPGVNQTGPQMMTCVLGVAFSCAAFRKPRQTPDDMNIVRTAWTGVRIRCRNIRVSGWHQGSGFMRGSSELKTTSVSCYDDYRNILIATKPFVCCKTVRLQCWKNNRSPVTSFILSKQVVMVVTWMQPELPFDHNEPVLLFVSSIFHIVAVQTIFGILNLLHVKAKKILNVITDGGFQTKEASVMRPLVSRNEVYVVTFQITDGLKHRKAQESHFGFKELPSHSFGHRSALSSALVTAPVRYRAWISAADASDRLVISLSCFIVTHRYMSRISAECNTGGP